jgi:hypothetical protein
MGQPHSQLPPRPWPLVLTSAAVALTQHQLQQPLQVPRMLLPESSGCTKHHAAVATPSSTAAAAGAALLHLLNYPYKPPGAHAPLRQAGYWPTALMH